MRLQTTTYWLISIALIITALVLGQSLIIPLIFALLIWFIVKKVRNMVDKVHFIQRYIPSWIKSIIASLIVFGSMLGIVDMLVDNIEDLAESYPKYANNVEELGERINTIFHINVKEKLTLFVRGFDFSGYLQSLLNSLSYILGNAMLMIFYTIFLFIEESLFRNKMKMILADRNKLQSFLSTMKKVDASMSSYISLKTFLNLITAILSYFILLGIGLDSPFFWAFLIFMFNFIPSVGQIVGNVLPALFALLQFGEFIPFLIILLGIGAIGLLVGSFLEPKLMGNTLNISPLIAIMALAFWGSIWGIVGMLLSVPITVAMIIVFAQFPQTRAVAILFSEKGRV